jgi:DNA-binding LacI/PurR family transcriptional regulator
MHPDFQTSSKQDRMPAKVQQKCEKNAAYNHSIMVNTKRRIVAARSVPAGQALYVQIEQWIRTRIDDHVLRDGDQLPTEIELCKRFRVSRSTIRQALSRLEQDGLVTRIRGKGTFLRQPALHSTPAAPATSERIIGLIACRKDDTLQMEILLGLERAAKSRDYSIIFSCSGDSPEGEQQEIERMMQRGVQGMVVMPVSNCATTPGVQQWVDHNLPLVLVDRYLTDLPTDYVTSDNYAGAYRATEHLVILGYRSLAFVCIGEGTLSTSSVDLRYKGFCGALDAYGLHAMIQPAHKIDVEDQATVRQLLRAMKRATHHDLPPAIVAAHDAVALAFMRTAAQLGLHAPRDFAIIGFDDLPVARQISVPLSTVTQQRFEMGFQAGHMLMDKIEGRVSSGGKRELPVSLVVRESCGAHRLVRERLTRFA